MSFAVVGTAVAVGAIAKGVGGIVKAIDGGIQKKRAKDHATNDCNLATKTAISLCNQVVTHIIGRLHGG